MLVSQLLLLVALVQLVVVLLVQLVIVLLVQLVIVLLVQLVVVLLVQLVVVLLVQLVVVLLVQLVVASLKVPGTLALAGTMLARLSGLWLVCIGFQRHCNSLYSSQLAPQH